MNETICQTTNLLDHCENFILKQAEQLLYLLHTRVFWLYMILTEVIIRNRKCIILER